MSEVLLVEDNLQVAEGVAGALRKQRGWNVQIASTVAAARAVELPLALAIVDLGLPDGDGTDVIGELTARGVRCVVFTIFDDRTTVLAAVAAGAVGYILKEEPIERIVVQLDECLDGGNPISSRVARYLFELGRSVPSSVALTEREEAVLGCLRRGDTYDECAAALGVRLGTVQTHVKNLYRKLDVTTKAEAAAWATRHR